MHVCLCMFLFVPDTALVLTNTTSYKICRMNWWRSSEKMILKKRSNFMKRYKWLRIFWKSLEAGFNKELLLSCYCLPSSGRSSSITIWRKGRRMTWRNSSNAHLNTRSCRSVYEHSTMELKHYTSLHTVVLVQDNFPMEERHTCAYALPVSCDTILNHWLVLCFVSKSAYTLKNSD